MFKIGKSQFFLEQQKQKIIAGNVANGRLEEEEEIDWLIPVENGKAVARSIKLPVGFSWN